MKLTTKKKLVVVRIFTILAIILILLTNVSTVFATEGATTGIAILIIDFVFHNISCRKD